MGSQPTLVIKNSSILNISFFSVENFELKLLFSFAILFTFRERGKKKCYLVVFETVTTQAISKKWMDIKTEHEISG